MGDEFTIADVAMIGWVRSLVGFWAARANWWPTTELKNVPAWLLSAPARPAVQRASQHTEAASKLAHPVCLRRSTLPARETELLAEFTRAQFTNRERPHTSALNGTQARFHR